MADSTTQITEGLASSETGMQPWLWLPVMRLLAQGDPVDIDDLAATTGRPVDQMCATRLRHLNSLEAVAETDFERSAALP